MTCPKCLVSDACDLGNRCSELSECFPHLHYNAPISSTPHLNDFDVDLHLQSNTNFRYLTTHDFHSDYEICECLKGRDCFAALHCNIRSLQANMDNFYNMLSQLSYPFSVIGLRPRLHGRFPARAEFQLG